MCSDEHYVKGHYFASPRFPAQSLTTRKLQHRYLFGYICGSITEKCVTGGGAWCDIKQCLDSMTKHNTYYFLLWANTAVCMSNCLYKANPQRSRRRIRSRIRSSPVPPNPLHIHNSSHDDTHTHTHTTPGPVWSSNRRLAMVNPGHTF